MGEFELSNLFLATRITSFNDPEWKHGSHFGHALADAGFFYLGHGDTVQCSKCDMELHKWDPKTEEPLIEHKRESPNCSRTKCTINSSHHDEPWFQSYGPPEITKRTTPRDLTLRASQPATMCGDCYRL